MRLYALEDILNAALLNEIKARNRYRKINDKFGRVRSFVDTPEAEQRYIEMFNDNIGSWPTISDRASIAMNRSRVMVMAENTNSAICCDIHRSLIACGNWQDCRSGLTRRGPES